MSHNRKYKLSVVKCPSTVVSPLYTTTLTREQVSDRELNKLRTRKIDILTSADYILIFVS